MLARAERESDSLLPVSYNFYTTHTLGGTYLYGSHVWVSLNISKSCMGVIRESLFILFTRDIIFCYLNIQGSPLVSFLVFFFSKKKKE
jgi:hypothetical protein